MGGGAEEEQECWKKIEGTWKTEDPPPRVQGRVGVHIQILTAFYN